MKIKLLISYIHNSTLYQILFWLLITYIIKEFILLNRIVYAEGWLSLQSYVIDKEALDAASNKRTPQTDFDVSVYKIAPIKYNPSTTELPTILPSSVQPDPSPAIENTAYNKQQNSSVVSDVFTEEYLKGILTVERITFVDSVLKRTFDILKVGSDKFDNDLISDTSIKNALHLVLTKYGDLPNWIAKTESDLSDIMHESNKCVHLIQSFIDNSKIQPLERRMLCHFATCITLENSISVLEISSEASEKLFNGKTYEDIYNKYAEATSQENNVHKQL